MVFALNDYLQMEMCIRNQFKGEVRVPEYV